MKKNQEKKNKIKKKKIIGILVVSHLFVFMAGFVAYKSLTSEGATFGWVQSDWTGGATSNTADHTDDQTGWSEYSGKDDNVDTSTLGEISLQNAAETTIEDTTDEDFQAATSSNPERTSISGGAVRMSTVGLHDVFNDGSAVATYNFDGDATDLGGNYDGTWNGTEVYATGQFNQAADFDGSSHIELTGDFGGVFDYSSRFSVSFWVKGDSFVFGFNNSNGYSGFGIRRNPSEYTDIIQSSKPDNGSGVIHTSLNESFSENDFVAIVKKGDDVFDLYKNGNYQSSYTLNNSGTASITENQVGAQTLSGLSNPHATGSIDQLRIFNRALTAEEVNQLYNE
jgi:hypothetical protein